MCLLGPSFSVFFPGGFLTCSALVPLSGAKCGSNFCFFQIAISWPSCHLFLPWWGEMPLLSWSPRASFFSATLRLLHDPALGHLVIETSQLISYLVGQVPLPPSLIFLRDFTDILRWLFVHITFRINCMTIKKICWHVCWIWAKFVC